MGDQYRVTVTDQDDVVVFRGRVGDGDRFELTAEAGDVPRVELTATGEGAFTDHPPPFTTPSPGDRLAMRSDLADRQDRAQPDAAGHGL